MRLSPDDIRARVLYRDGNMLVLDKPAGIAVHKGPKGGETLDAYFPELQFEAAEQPQLAHRLDRETSGCLVLGRHKNALKRLGAMFADGRIRKIYLALCCGVPAEPEGSIDLPLARRSHDKRSWWMKVDPAGDPSFTRYRLLASRGGLSFLALQPETGRTHQLRVHCSAMGWPIAGDKVYGGDRALAASRHLQLHAARIRIPVHGGPAVEVTAPLPSAMSDFLGHLGLKDFTPEDLPSDLAP